VPTAEDTLTPDAVARALAVRDLTDPTQGPHAIQRVLDAAVKAVASAWRCEVVPFRASPLVSEDDHYARLRDLAGEPARWVSPATLLRTRAAALVPPALARLAAAPPRDALLALPGVVFRGAAGDRLRAREGHELELWRIRRGAPFGLREVAELIGLVTRATLPGMTLSTLPVEAAWLTGARQVDVRVRGEWVTIGTCGAVDPRVLADAGLPPDAAGVALTLDLDRAVLLAKGLDDVALLRSRDPRVATQMLDLAPFVPAADVPAPPCATLDEVRASIDELDGRIVSLLAERRGYVLQAARFKASPEAVRVPAREAQVLSNVKALAYRAGIEPELVEALYRQMIDGFVRIEVAAHPARRAAREEEKETGAA
jgi:phenylalanyl-tRNA synthetase alpha chain